MAGPWSATAPPGGPRLLLGSLAVQGRESALAALVDRRAEGRELVRGDVALCRVYRFALPAVDGDEGTGAEVPLLPQQRARTADLAPGLPGGLPNVRQRLVSRAPRLAQPPSRDLPVGLLLQATTRAEPVEVAVDGQL